MAVSRLCYCNKVSACVAQPGRRESGSSEACQGGRGREEILGQGRCAQDGVGMSQGVLCPGFAAGLESCLVLLTVWSMERRFVLYAN